MSFSGFTLKTQEFFENLEKNNNRDWFIEHKTEYEEYVKKPAQELVETMAPMFQAEHKPYICNPKKGVFRLNRDVRFSKNKDPYKTNLGVYFPYNPHSATEKLETSTGLYFHYESGACFVGGGMYAPMSPDLKSIRAYILEHYEDLKDILNEDLFKKVFPKGLYGESLKKTPLGFPKEHPADEFLKMKSYLVGFDYDFKKACTSEIVETLFISGLAMAPLMDFLFRAKS